MSLLEDLGKPDFETDLAKWWLEKDLTKYAKDKKTQVWKIYEKDTKDLVWGITYNGCLNSVHGSLEAVVSKLDIMNALRR